MKFIGTGVAVITPFKSNGEVDKNALTNLINHLINNGIDYLVALGTTAESATLTNQEKTEIIDLFIEHTKGRVPLVVGAGGNNTANVVELVKELSNKNIDGLLSVCPYYNKPNQTGLYEHFKQVLSATNKDVILYNVPGRTASNLQPETVIKLAKEFSNAVAIKEASGSITQSMEILQHAPKDFVVLSGEDALTLPLMAIGVRGVISVIAHIYPREFSDMVRMANAGNYEGAKVNHYKVLDMTNAIFAEGNPTGVKYALHKKGLIENELRLPLVRASQGLMDRIDQLLA
ncbi:MAG: 4-hydroxy-tetrahydrodipicolinate synthase [Bacteroidetes bacterium]|nr:4-hydroxy-tetrahydrodipicolinate synthase [Bacteroidota bacterium]